AVISARVQSVLISPSPSGEGVGCGIPLDRGDTSEVCSTPIPSSKEEGLKPLTVFTRSIILQPRRCPRGEHCGPAIEALRQPPQPGSCPARRCPAPPRRAGTGNPVQG